jgi:hypothetical protein
MTEEFPLGWQISESRRWRHGGGRAGAPPSVNILQECIQTKYGKEEPSKITCPVRHHLMHHLLVKKKEEECESELDLVIRCCPSEEEDSNG